MGDKESNQIESTASAEDDPLAISVSRRTDIPAYYGAWFLDKLHQGKVRYSNPFSGAVYELSLSKENVLLFLFWSKNYAPFFPVLKELAASGYPFYCHYTITGLPNYLEPNVPASSDAVAAFRKLAELVSPARVYWRFDPIVISNDISCEATVSRFKQLCTDLQGFTSRCYLSYVDRYKKITANLKEFPIRTLTHKESLGLLGELTGCAEDCGIDLYACCEPEWISSRVKPAACMDLETARRITNNPTLHLASRPTREGCGCYVSRDIGAYDTCPAGCRYCYATAHPATAKQAYDNHCTTWLNLKGPN